MSPLPPALSKLALLADLVAGGIEHERAEELLDYLWSAFETDQPDLFAQYVEWRSVLDAERGQGAKATGELLDRIGERLRELPSDADSERMLEILRGGHEALATVTPPQRSFLEDGPHALLAREYSDLLLEGRRREATERILRAVDDGLSIQELYLEVFQPSQWEVGRLWQLNRLSVGQEHFFTAATQAVMAQLYPRIFSGRPNGRRLVATSIRGELHEIGIRMVADFLELEGWDTHCLGSNLPIADIVAAVVERRAELLAVSVTLPPHLVHLNTLVRAVRAAQPSVRILVGGHAVAAGDEVWRRLGADAFAEDAATAVTAATSLLEAA